MSISGVRSNRGDGYQTLVAFDWALTVLSDPEVLWLEIDSIEHSVDDIVVCKTDGTLIGCQCKKNQPDFKAWSISDLGEEVDKASSFLSATKNAEVRFYSRNNFGDLAKLREHSSTQKSEVSYQASLSKEHQTTDAALTTRLSKTSPVLSPYEFLRRTKFVSTDELERMVDVLRERLRNLASNPDAAFSALWTRLDQLGARIGEGSTSAIRHRLTKDDLKAIVHGAGAMLVAPMDIAEVRRSFADTSAIGRSWRRDIAGEYVPTPVVNEILAAIDAKKRAILLTGMPGAGKTCAMLELQDTLERRAKAGLEVTPIYIQSREFADLVTAQDRHSQGLSEQWVEKASRLAEHAHVVVVIDSLDVLSIARDHRVLTYFLAQIDRLLLVPNITVVTACRDFDRHYDRRIAERKWDSELKCQHLNWTTEISPLLDRLGISTTSLDVTTKDLIKNPRELALFVELALRGGSFNVVTSQALAQRYLDTIVRDSSELGDEAIQAIETVASEMLTSRSLTVSHQRFTASQEILRLLCSLNVMQHTQDGRLTFGHQTLLDVLVISRALRHGTTLNEFIQGLPPVPFVRPSIRSFVAQLALGDRREFRKQIRTVLTGSAAFHIRRLVAEAFSEQKPHAEDWPLVRDLRETHRDVFQVIYGAGGIEWHHFWLKHLIPQLRSKQDADSMATHAYRIRQWANEDMPGVLALWMETLSLDWLDSKSIAEQLGFHLSSINPENIPQIAPLLQRLLDFPRTEHSYLGRVIARCLDAGVANDQLLWNYITDGVSEEDISEFRFGDKLRCSSHEFGDSDKNFIRDRMKQSTALLDMALESIRHWSNVRSSRYGETFDGYRHGFLSETSYERTHSQRDFHHAESMSVLLDAVEAAIIHHANENSIWWLRNRESLCSDREGALIYFAVLACTASPETNIDLVGGMLRESKLLEFELSYELGTLIQSAFVLLDAAAQDAVTSNILTLWGEGTPERPNRPWILISRASFIAAIPCHQRSPEAQGLLDSHENQAGKMIRSPEIRSRGGVVSAPFAYKVFLTLDDTGVFRILSHYVGYERSFDDLLVGGEREVGGQLREASSRNPMRFLGLLHDNWEKIPDRFRDDIMHGAANYLAHRHGNLQPNGSWEPIEEPNASGLADLILDELEKHPKHWKHNRSAAAALEACSNVVYDTQSAERLVFLAIGFECHHEEDPIHGSNVDLVSVGINMLRGDIAEALMILANNLLEHGSEFPQLLAPALRRFASDSNPAIRSLILRRLPYIQSKSFDFGWDLFHLAMKDAEKLWKVAEPCLYYAYHSNFDVVSPLLARLRREGEGKSLATWGRISALSAMDQKIEFTELLRELSSLSKTEAWQGSATVWTNLENMRQHREQCFAGLHAAFNGGANHEEAIAKQVARIFQDKSASISIPIELLRHCFEAFKKSEDSRNNHHSVFGLHEWLNATSQHDPELALASTEIYLDYVSDRKSSLYDHENSLTQLMTRLFSEAEEREESDNGSMLQRVVAVQDTLLSLGVNGVADWLKAAERP